MNKESSKQIKLFRVGFITFVSFIIFFYGMKFLQNENFQKSTISFKIVFKNSQGIDSGDEVRMLGKKIGFVTAANIIGENIVLIVAAGEHRKETFKACEWAIAELKRTTPIWKRETTTTGEVWVQDTP